MRTTEEVTAELKRLQKERQSVWRRFRRYKNSHDMRVMEDYDAQIVILEWVLSGGKVK